MDLITILTAQRDSLREATRHADSKASPLLIAPGAALTTMSTVAALTGPAKVAGTVALVAAVAVIPAIVAAIWPRRPHITRQTAPSILATAERMAADEGHTADRIAVETAALQRIIATKWVWTRVALGLTAAAVALAGVAAVL
jgi:hypothetical protein